MNLVLSGMFLSNFSCSNGTFLESSVIQSLISTDCVHVPFINIFIITQVLSEQQIISIFMISQPLYHYWYLFDQQDINRTLYFFCFLSSEYSSFASTSIIIGTFRNNEISPIVVGTFSDSFHQRIRHYPLWVIIKYPFRYEFFYFNIIKMRSKP